MHALSKNIRFYVLVFSITLSILIVLFIKLTVSIPSSQIIQLEESYGLLSLLFVYLALLAGPFCYRFRGFIWRSQYLHARRAIGVSAFYFALLHSSISFFGQLGGISGLGFLSSYYLVAILLGFFALIILSLLAATSFDKVVDKMTFSNWKFLHRFIYLGGILILIHIVLLGAHYTDLSNTIPLITFIGLIFLLFLEEPRFYGSFKTMFPKKPIPQVLRGVVFTSAILGIGFYLYSYIILPVIAPQSASKTFVTHAGHEAMLESIKNLPPAEKINNNTIPALDGDITKRYTVGMFPDPANPKPNEEVTIRFQIYDANTGERVTNFRLFNTSMMHMLIVNNELTSFTRVTPQQNGKEFTVTTTFPEESLYHFSIQFQPVGGIVQQMAFNIPVGDEFIKQQFSTATPSKTLEKLVGNYKIYMDTNGPLQVEPMTKADEEIALSITDAGTSYPVKTLKPYFGTFGHLTLVNQKTFEFISLFPTETTQPLPDVSGGPEVKFVPIGLYGTFKPGIYRAFAELNPDNKPLIADFTVELQ